MTLRRTLAAVGVAFAVGVAWGYRHGWQERTRAMLRLEQHVSRVGTDRVVDQRGEWHGD